MDTAGDTTRAGVELGAPIASARCWWLPSELTRAMHRVPPWGGWHGALLPAAVSIEAIALVAAYFGVPSAALHAFVCALVVGHFWPGWRAREMAEYWTPRERHLQVDVSSGGLYVDAAGRAEAVPFTDVSGVVTAEKGWLLLFADRPPLWMPWAAFGERGLAAVGERFEQLPTRRRREALPWLYVVGLAASALGTTVWYLAASA